MILNRFNKLFSPEGEGGGSGGAGDGGAGGTGGPQTILGSGGAGGGEPAKPWYHELPDDLKTSPYVAASKDLAGFVKSAVDTKSMVGANVVKLPGEKATAEEIEAFYTKLGRPAEPKAYVPTVAPKAEGIIDAASLEAMQTAFHKLGLTEAQGKGILDNYLTTVNAGYDATEAANTAAREQNTLKLKQEWGAEFDNNLKTAQLALRQLGDENLAKEIAESGFGNNASFIKFMHSVGVKLLDDDAIGGEGGGEFGGTPMAAQQEISRLKMDKDFQEALNTAHHVAHKDAVDRWTALHRKAFPGKVQE